MSQALKGAHGGSILDTAWSFVSEEECAWILAGKPAGGRQFLQQSGNVDGRSYSWVVQYDHSVITAYEGFSQGRSSKVSVLPIVNVKTDPGRDWNAKITTVLEEMLEKIPGLKAATKDPSYVFIPSNNRAHSDMIFDDGKTFVSIHNKHNNVGGRYFATSGTEYSPESSANTPRGQFISQGLQNFSTALANAGAPTQLGAFIAAFNQKSAKGKAIRIGIFRHLEARAALKGGNSYLIDTVNSKKDWKMTKVSVGPLGTFGVTAKNADKMVMVKQNESMGSIQIDGKECFRLQVRGRATPIVFGPNNPKPKPGSKRVQKSHHEIAGVPIMENKWKNVVRNVLLLEEDEEYMDMYADGEVSPEDVDAMGDFILSTLEDPDEAPIEVDPTSVQESFQSPGETISESRWLKLAGILKD